MPEGWAWCRLSMMVSELGDGLHGTPNYNSKGQYFFVNGNNLANGKIEIKDDTKRVDDSEYQKYKKSLSNNTILVSINGTLGNVAFYNNEPIILGKSACYFNLLIAELKQYCFYFLISDYFKKYAEENATGSTIKNVSLQSMRSLLIPLPPLNQQERIITAIEKAITKIDFLEQNQSDLQTAIEQTKSKILDLAIHGKLVSQDPNDEPAEELLRRIVTSDNRPYKKLSGDEIPFELPETWIWQKLPDLCSIPITDGTHKTPTYSDKENGIPFLSSKDVTSGEIDWSKIKYITKELHEELYKRLAPQKNDILLAKNGTTGIAALVKDNSVFDIYVTLALIRPISEIIYPQYLLYIINSQFCKNQFNDHLTGIGVPNLHLVDINKTVIPLPPLSEQQRIVLKIEELFEYTDIINISIKEF